VRYAILYFVLLVVFLALIIGPIIAGKWIDFKLEGLPFEIMQPSGFSNNDTTNTPTGSCIHGPCPPYRGGDADGGGGGEDAAPTDAESTDDAGRRLFRRYMAY
jgi:1,3-beta-glucan synthase